jgi:hypothetical protein
MLNVPTPFPHQGSTGYLIPNADRRTAERVRIVQHRPGDEVLVARQRPEGGGREAQAEFFARGATRELTVKTAELRATAEEAARATLPKLSPHQRGQLSLLDAHEAYGRDSAVAVSFDRAFNPSTLGRLLGMSLVEQADLPFHGDRKRRVSHYWLTDRGQLAIAGGR